MKKIIAILSLISTVAFAGNLGFTGPKFEINGYLGYNWSNGINITAMPTVNWDLKLNDNLNLDLGVKGLVQGTYYSKKSQNTTKDGSIKLAPAFNLDLEVKTKNPKYKGYVGADLGVGATIFIDGAHIDTKASPVANLRGGVKISDKYKVGVYIGTEGVGLDAGFKLK